MLLSISFNSTVRIFLRRSLFTFGLLSVFGVFFFISQKEAEQKILDVFVSCH